VEKVNPDLVVKDEEGKVTTVRYEAVNAMLLNEFLKEHRAVQELKTTVAVQQAVIAQQKTEFQEKLAEHEKDFQTSITQQQKQIEQLNAGLQKVNEQVSLQKAAPELVANRQ
jgi:small-conductance mechanosensitive channel